jgi:2-haloacid dehalogenase
MLTMPAHPDVPSGLKQLKDAVCLVTYTNSPPEPQASPLKHAGIDGWFEKSCSVDRVRRFKPAPQVYQMVAEELNVQPAAIGMVAAHVWDTIGAQSVGCSGRSSSDPANAPLPVRGLPQPQVVAWDLPGGVRANDQPLGDGGQERTPGRARIRDEWAHRRRGQARPIAFEAFWKGVDP